MKKKVRLILIITAFCSYFAFVYWITYRYTYEDLINNKLYDESQLIPPTETTEEYTPVFKASATADDNKYVTNTKSPEITAKTTYILEKFDKLSGELTKEIIPIPIELLGLDCDGVFRYIKSENEKPSNENICLEMVVFQNGLLVLRQTFESNVPDYMFRLVAEHGKIVVYEYYEDVVYAKTNIKVIDLPYELQKELENELPIEDEKELFMFLESYSS